MIVAAVTANVAMFVLLAFILATRGYLNVYSGLFVYLLFHFMVFVQRPLVVYLFDLRSEYIFMGYFPSDEMFVSTLMVANIGLLAFAFGYLAVLGFRPIMPTFKLPRVDAADRRALLLSALLLSPIIIYSMYLGLTTRTLPSAEEGIAGFGRIDMKYDPQTGTYLFTDTSAYLVLGRHMALPIATCIIYFYSRRWWSFVPLLLCAFVAMYSGGRWPLLISTFVLIAMTLHQRHRMFFRLREVVLALLALLVFAVIGENREALFSLLSTGDIAVEFDLFKSSFGAHPDFANFEFLTYVLAKVPDVSGTYSYFTQYLGLLTQPIPRMIWPDKPIGSPITLVNLNAYGNFASRTTSLVGDGWISLGYIGVVITLGLAGAFYGWLYKRVFTTNISVYYYCAYFWLIALLVQWARDGGSKIAEFFFFCLMPIALAYVLRIFMSNKLKGRRRRELFHTFDRTRARLRARDRAAG